MFAKLADLLGRKYATYMQRAAIETLILMNLSPILNSIPSKGHKVVLN